MKSLWIGFGLGIAAGALLFNNCKWMRNAVADTQERIKRKMESKSEYDDFSDMSSSESSS